jgi:ribonuclease D
MISHKLLFNGLNKGASFQAVVKELLSEDLDKSLQASDWGGELAEEQLAYAARDSLILEPVYIGQKALLEQAGLVEVAELEFATIPAIIELEYNGMSFTINQARERLEDFANWI